MAEQVEYVGAARTQYTDWVGTVAADDDITIYSKNLYELAGLDSKEWTIVGIDVYVSRGSDGDVAVYAANRDQTGVTKYDEWEPYVRVHGSIPVTRFALEGVSLEDVIDTTKRMKLSFRYASMDRFDWRVEHSRDSSQ